MLHASVRTGAAVQVGNRGPRYAGKRCQRGFPEMSEGIRIRSIFTFTALEDFSGTVPRRAFMGWKILRVGVSVAGVEAVGCSNLPGEPVQRRTGASGSGTPPPPSRP